ncbi:MAG: NAD-dependent epimerase/dehydratase family protein [Planctomycetota bacterium]
MPDPIRPILVTGANGFIGRTVVAELVERGESVRALVRSEEKGRALEAMGAGCAIGDLTEADSLEDAVRGCSAVIHLAGLVRARHRDELFAANESGCRNLARACLALEEPPRRFVSVSSLAAAGPARGRPKVESDEPAPVSDYGRSKLAGERAIEQELSGRIPFAIVRPPAVYGPGDRDVLTFFEMADRGWLPKFSGPERQYSFVHVEDLARGVIEVALADHLPSRVYFLADAEVYAWSRLVSGFSMAVGRKVGSVPIPFPALWLVATVQELWARLRKKAPLLGWDKLKEMRATAWTCDARRARDELGFRIDRTLEEGLAETAAWYREQGWLKRRA